MILTCPACTTRYLVDPSAIGNEGRRVRCARCQHTWHAEQEAEEASAAPIATEEDEAPAPATAAAAPADDDSQDDAADSAASRRRSTRAKTQLPAVREPAGKGIWIAWLVLIIVVAGVIAGGVVFRRDVVAVWPPAGRLYLAAGLSLEPDFTLQIQNIEWARESRGGQSVLLVSGEIANPDDVRQKVPRIQVILFDENRRVLHHWNAQVPQQVLNPKQTTSFTTELRDPPDEARGLQVTFLLDG